MISAVLLLSCASQPPVTPASPPAAGRARNAPPPAPSPVAAARKPPRFLYPSNIDWYPTQAKRHLDTGRVLVEFKIDTKGKAVSMKILRAEAPRILRKAALDFITDVTFDVTDPTYAAADSDAAFAISVRFCIADCASVPGFPGYEDARITGSPVSPLYDH